MDIYVLLMGRDQNASWLVLVFCLCTLGTQTKNKILFIKKDSLSDKPTRQQIWR